MVEQIELAPRLGREGNRWANKRPTGEEVGEWFSTIKLHDGMEHKDWLSGIVLIESTEKHDEVVGFAADGRPQIVKDVQNVFYVPYPKAETRVNYFHALAASEENWTGFILPVPAADPKGMAPGFFAMRVALPDGKTASMVCYTARALILSGDVTWVDHYDSDGVVRAYPEGKIVLQGAHGTKAVPLLDRYGKPDPNAVMKAQTGAIGRALGFAGVLVIPGTGVATAEDMQEALTQGNTPGAPPAAPEEPQEPEDSDLVLRRHAGALIQALHEDHPETLAAFQAWARERKFGKLADTSGPALKGVVKKLQKMLETVQAEAVPRVDLSGDEAPTPVGTPDKKEEEAL